ncbi:synaptosomal-associated protein 25-like [Hyposmocoma kahamanoa]|uniref:synaptosomal-associated protein 25-like n=1 Tax=Hyposmocoma kahamanoa TaxID=1477025 RepID=UPI000E6D872D|nr:synaptosomal-associated protein 25-like [Hyposmocoma kahamanoa]
MSSGDNDDHPSSGVVLLQARSKQIANQTLDSTRRMVNMTDESSEIGNRTMIALNEQGEKLNFIDEANRAINEDVRQAEKNIEGMEKCCGIFSFSWTRSKSNKADKVWKENEEEVVSIQPQRVSIKEDPPGFYIDKITNDEMEDEMQQNLTQVHSTVGNLRNLAASLNSEVLNQNRQLDKINQKVESNEIHVITAEKRTQKFATNSHGHALKNTLSPLNTARTSGSSSRVVSFE